MSIKEMVLEKAKNAKQASRILAKTSTSAKNNALNAMADGLLSAKDELKRENEKDIAYAKEKGLSSALIDRLTLNDKRIEAMANGIKEIVALPDPVGEVTRMWQRPNGLRIGKIRVPLGVIGIIYESRPNVTADAVGLCIKSGNAIILRGGSEAINSNIAIANILVRSAMDAGLPEGCIQLIDITDRQAIMEMVKLDEYIDLIVARGGLELIKVVSENSTIPVAKHSAGICHTYVDADADLQMAEDICFNAKVQRPGVCNAMETMLVHKDIAHSFLPRMIQRFKEAGVEIRGCAKTKKIVPDIIDATEEDWWTEYLDLILSIKIVDDINEAIDHIMTYGSHHSDAIVTKDYDRAMKFLNEVDSSAVYVNASTRFTDGNEFGLGAELGISTQKLHSRGPMGLEDLTSQKYIIFGNGQIRQ
ncbi:TPA: glutamate-5-semialdehyde dehydrogenase [Candidatus Poribacteria bacterium]|nr:glutamate-5-semialdehyde dehydrogenase [Candidatus Poribacteria bacterium]